MIRRQDGAVYRRVEAERGSSYARMKRGSWLGLGAWDGPEVGHYLPRRHDPLHVGPDRDPASGLTRRNGPVLKTFLIGDPVRCVDNPEGTVRLNSRSRQGGSPTPHTPPASPAARRWPPEAPGRAWPRRPLRPPRGRGRSPPP